MKGQISVEFFLIIGVVLAFAALLLANAQRELTDIRLLDNAALSRGALQEVSHAANFVELSGNGSRLMRTVFVPHNTVCFVKDPGRNALMCDLGNSSTGQKRVYGERLVQPTALVGVENCFRSGWLDVTVERLNSTLNITCA